MFDGNSDSAGCMRYCTWSRTGRMPRRIRRSNNERDRPARAAFLHMTTGPSWQWSPTMTSCLAPRTMGISASGSVAWVASSTRTWRKRKLASLGSPLPTHVQQITSAFCRMAFSAALCSVFKRLWSFAESSPEASFRRSSLYSSLLACSASWRTRRWRDRNSTEEDTASRLFATRRTTLSEVACIFSQSWSTATLLGAHTRTWLWLCWARWYTIVADVTVFPVPGGPWMRLRGLDSTLFTAATWEWLRAGSPGAEMTEGRLVRTTCCCTSWPRMTW
mmetsp:Transcript_21139/g.42526  ORF Transcript_21139/g.42526 Transcript_21139/m.42526 type:complete len:276 (+) Transcript_21139:1544-2371(+)